MRAKSIVSAAAAVAIAFLLQSQPARASAPAAQEQPRPNSMQQLAESLIPSFEGKNADGDLATLMQLQIAAGRYSDAATTLDRLAALRRTANRKGALRLIPWQMYLRAEIRAAGNEGELPSAFDEAFRETVTPLDDKTAVDLLPLFGINLPAARQQLEDAEKACPSLASTCPDALRLALASAFVSAWSVIAPASKELLKEDVGRRFLVDDQLLIPTPDGAKIATLVIRPRSPGKLISLMNFTIYAYDDWALSDAAKMAAYGYAGVVAYTRGKGRSPGPTVPYEHDGADAAAVIDWIAGQSWSDGRVGMFSGSYNAFTQWAAVKHMPKALKAIATNASNAPRIDTPMERNIFENFIYPWPLYTTTTKGLNDDLYFDPTRWNALNRKWYLSGRPYRDLDKIDGLPNPVFDEWLKHPSYDAYWQKLVPYGDEFARVTIPVFVQTGYFDGGMVGALYYLRQHYKYDPKANHRLLLGPYHHTAMTAGVLNNFAGYDIDEAARIDLQDVRLKWFDHVFRGAPLPELLSDRINFEVMGANKWRHVASLDAMGSEQLRLYLGGARQGKRLMLSRTRPAKGSSARLTVDFKDRSDVDYQAPTDMFSRELDTRNALVFATAPFAAPIEVDGALLRNLDVVTNKKDFDLSISVYEQLKDGRYFPLMTFIGRASYLADRSRRHLLVPGRAQSLAFESDRVTARRSRSRQPDRRDNRRAQAARLPDQLRDRPRCQR